LTREGLIWLAMGAVLLVVGLLKAINLLALLACMLVVLVFWNVWLARRQLRRVDAQRWDDELPFAQTLFHATVRVGNTGRRAIGGLEVRDGDGATPLRWFVPTLGPDNSVVLRAAVTFPRRGPVLGAGLVVSSGYPIGLARWERSVEAVRRIVLPRLGTLHRAQLRRFLSRHSPNVGQTRSLPVPSPTAQAEFHGLRPYRPGDSPRHVHWRTTARYGELMVREYEDWPNDDLTVVLEAVRPDDQIDDPQFELAISLAATICWEWCRQTGDRLTLVVAGKELTVQEGVTGKALAKPLLERLALEPGCAAVASDCVVAELATRTLPAGPILAISPRPSDLGPRLQQALRRRVAPVAIASGDVAAFFDWPERQTS
jgi:uncharacterized protein (DUF58 family)